MVIKSSGIALLILDSYKGLSLVGLVAQREINLSPSLNCFYFNTDSPVHLTISAIYSLHKPGRVKSFCFVLRLLLSTHQKVEPLAESAQKDESHGTHPMCSAWLILKVALRNGQICGPQSPWSDLIAFNEYIVNELYYLWCASNVCVHCTACLIQSEVTFNGNWTQDPAC